MSRCLALLLAMVLSLSAQGWKQIHVTAPFAFADHAVLDVDGDGQNEVLFLAAKAPYRFALYQRDSNAVFQEMEHGAVLVSADVAAWTVLDFVPPKGDDLILHAATGVRVVSWTSSGITIQPELERALLWDRTPSAPPAHVSSPGDIDGDGHDDLLLFLAQGDELHFGRGAESRVRPPLSLNPPWSCEYVKDGRGALSRELRRPRLGFARTFDPQVRTPILLRARTLEALTQREGGFGEPTRPLYRFGAEGLGKLGSLERTEIEVADLNGDQLDDWLIAHTRAETGHVPELKTELRIVLNNGALTTQPTQGLVLSGVLSSGPDIQDVDGDGRKDLFLSVFAGGLGSEWKRRITGSVTLNYHLYLGARGDRPFPRSPEVLIEDTVPLALFDVWALRHRVFVGDLTGDGRSDLIRITQDGDRARVTLQEASPPSKAFHFAKEFRASVEIDGPFTGYALRHFDGTRQKLELRKAQGLAFLSLEP